MKVKYVGDYYKVMLHKNKIYEVIDIENGWYKLFDEMNETSFYPPDGFEIMEN